HDHSEQLARGSRSSSVSRPDRPRQHTDEDPSPVEPSAERSAEERVPRERLLTDHAAFPVQEPFAAREASEQVYRRPRAPGASGLQRPAVPEAEPADEQRLPAWVEEELRTEVQPDYRSRLVEIAGHPGETKARLEREEPDAPTGVRHETSETIPGGPG